MTAHQEREVPELRVALFTGNYDYIRDGVALTLNRLVAHLLEHKIPTRVFAPTAEKAAFDSVGDVVSVPSIPVPGRPEYRVALGLNSSTRKAIMDFRPTLIHVATPDLLGFQALQLAKKNHTAVVSSFHTRYEAYVRYYGLGFLTGLCKLYAGHFYRQCDCVYVPCASMADELLREGLIGRHEIWSRGVDSTLFDPAKRSMAWRESQGVAPDDLLVSYFGRLVKEKNVLQLKEIFQTLEQRGIGFRPMIVGAGPLEAALRTALPNAIFTGGVAGEELARAYASSDIYLFPSQSESFGNVTLEAMASGLPAVCANATGSKSLVVHGETGFLAKNNLSHEFADHLFTLLANDAQRRRFGQAARQRSLEFRWDTILESLLASYRSVIAFQALKARGETLGLDQESHVTSAWPGKEQSSTPGKGYSETCTFTDDGLLRRNPD